MKQRKYLLEENNEYSDVHFQLPPYTRNAWHHNRIHENVEFHYRRIQLFLFSIIKKYYKNRLFKGKKSWRIYKESFAYL